MKRFRIFAAGLAMLFIAGCAENPKEDIVVHKDMEQVIEEAQQTDEREENIEALQQYNHYATDIRQDNLNVSIHIDAQVDIPKTDKLSIYRVRQHTFTQADVDKIRNALFGDTPLYDGVEMVRETKSHYEAEIANVRATIDGYIAEVPKNEREEETRTAMIAEWQDLLDRLQKDYEAAPVEAKKLLSDGKLQNVAEKLAAGDNQKYWSWQDELGCVEALQLRNEDNTAVMYVQNNPDLSNKITFQTAPVGVQKNCPATVGLYPLTVEQGSGLPENFLSHRVDIDGKRFEQMPGDSCTISDTEAKEQADAFLAEIGLDEMACISNDKYTELLSGDLTKYRTCWIIRYQRCLDGVMLDQASGQKFTDGWQGEQYVKQIWPAEGVELHINDTGIVEFSWHAPIEISETVVDATTLKPFSEICSTFERMMPMVSAETNIPAESGRESIGIDIDRVTLTYSRISEKDRFDTGLIVPVWGFIGSHRGGLYADWEGVQMAINAIDGSVIDSALGY